MQNNPDMEFTCDNDNSCDANVFVELMWEDKEGKTWYYLDKDKANRILRNNGWIVENEHYYCSKKCKEDQEELMS